jgi:Protein of unknown function (DUF4058)
MASPFPGMDPYIEFSHLWEDFHTHLIDEIYRALSDALPDRYIVRAGERSYVSLAVPDAEYREPFLEIRQGDPEHKLVTGIEVLSPSNKRPNTKGWRLYHRKRSAFLSGYANLVEIDLLRGGRRMPMASAWPDSPYYLLVCRKKRASRCAVWPAYSSEPLPSIPIPLAPPDADISLALQPFVEAIYARSRYERDINYRRALDPPLSAAETAWLEARLRQQQHSI